MFVRAGEKKTERTEMTVDITTRTTQRSEVQVTQISETGEENPQAAPAQTAAARCAEGRNLRDIGVSSAPVFISPLRSLTTAEGSSPSFCCAISAEPPPQVTWFRDGEVLHDPDLYIFDSRRDEYSLLIHDVLMEDGGVYECHATNTHGVASSVATLTVTPAGVCASR